MTTNKVGYTPDIDRVTLFVDPKLTQKKRTSVTYDVHTRSDVSEHGKY